ncbi:unnamed protein product [Caenorhabditis brenneri]
MFGDDVTATDANYHKSSKCILIKDTLLYAHFCVVRWRLSQIRTKEEAWACALTGDGTFSKLGNLFTFYILCVSYNINLLAERVVKPLNEHKALLDPDVVQLLFATISMSDWSCHAYQNCRTG